jgi:hypothetical protein
LYLVGRIRFLIKGGKIMKRTALILALVFCAVSSVMANGISVFNGHWVNTDQNTGGIARLDINQAGNVVTVQAWANVGRENRGRHKQQDYTDLGKKIGTPYSINVDTKVADNTQAVISNFDNSFSKRTLLIEAPFQRTLRVREFVSFTDRSNRSAYTNSYVFNRTDAYNPTPVIPVMPVKPVFNYPAPVRPEFNYPVPVRPVIERPVQPQLVYPVRPEIHHPVQPGIVLPYGMQEDKIKFDWRNLRVKKVNNSWKIMEGTSHMMMDFGSNLREASQALGVIQRYRMDEMCFVGRPDPSMTYFLSNGVAPEGEKPGEDAIRFDPQQLDVVKINNSWKILEGRSHSMMDFGVNEIEARQSLRIIKKYGFTHICFIGRPNPSMTYFRK